MDTYQYETRSRMIKRSAIPAHRVMALRAILWEVTSLVRWVVGTVVVRLMAVPTSAAGQAVIVVHMALNARYAGVSAGQHEARNGVVELGVSPDVHSMTCFAGERKIRRRVVHRPALLIVREVAGDALGTQAGVDSGRRPAVAIVAGGRCVCSD